MKILLAKSQPMQSASNPSPSEEIEHLFAMEGSDGGHFEF